MYYGASRAARAAKLDAVHARCPWPVPPFRLRNPHDAGAGDGDPQPGRIRPVCGRTIAAHVGTVATVFALPGWFAIMTRAKWGLRGQTENAGFGSLDFIHRRILLNSL